MRAPPVPIVDTVKALASPEVPTVETRWQIQRQIPLAVLVGVIGNIIAVVVTYINLQRDVQENSRRLTIMEDTRAAERIRSEPLLERFYKNESVLDQMTRLLNQMETRVERLEESRQNNGAQK